MKKARVPLAPVEPAASSVATPRTANPPAPVQRATWLRAVLPIAAVALVVAAVAFPRRSPAPAATGSDAQEQIQTAVAVAPSTPPIAPAPVPNAAPAAASIVATARAVSEPPKKPTVKPATNRVTGSGKSLAPVAAAAVADPPKKDDDPAPKPAAPEATASPATTATAVVSAPVTITGCLEVSTDGDTFRLSDVEGADAPTSRSWRTGFFRKRPAPVVLVEPPDRQALATNVGHRVAATGQLASRELKLSSLRVVGSSCN